MQTFEVREAVTITHQGQKMFGVLHLPYQMERPVPAVLICSGFAGSKCGKYRVFVALAQELARQGVAVMRFDYRGAGDSEGEFSEITIESQVSDTLACLNFLKKDLRIDGVRLGLMGRSLGGVITVLSAVQYQAVKSLALWAPVFSSEPWKKMWETLAIASPEAMKQGALSHLPPNIPSVPSVEFLKQFFRVDLKKELNQIRHIPLLHVHGKQDEFVAFEHAIAYEQACQRQDHARFISLPNSNHDFSNEVERKLAVEETCQWFQQTLGCPAC